MKLYHYSNKKIDDKIKIEYFGNNSFTFREKQKCNIPRSFFYLSTNIPEYHLKNSKYCYIIEIDKNKLYDLRKDKKQLISKFNSIYDLLLYISKRYIGVIYNIGFDVACLFKDIEYIKKINLRA